MRNAFAGAAALPQRLAAVDRLRGVIIAFMALDHASYFIARMHPFEGWNASPPWYATVGEFATRWVTHLCAPGFFLLMGAGMVWLAEARRQAGWSRARIVRFFVSRGAVLVLLQQLGENPAWILSTISAAPDGHSTVIMPPGGGTDFFLHLGVLNALGVAMIVWAFLIDLPDVLVAAVVAVALGAGLWMTPSPGDHGTLFAPWLRLLFIPGHTDFINVMYPLVPWLPPAGLGILLGRAVVRGRQHIARLGLGAGLALLALAAILRAWGVGDVHRPVPSVAGWLSITKYPPSAVFLAMTLGVDLLLLALFSATARRHALAPLEVFGRSPLFFYVAHLWLFAIVSFAFPSGSSLTVAYAVWIVALAILFPLCRWFAAFKSTRPVESAWRLL